MKKDRKTRCAAFGAYYVKVTAALFAFAIFAFGHSAPMREIRELPSAYYAESEQSLAKRLGASAFPHAVTADSRYDETLGCRTVSIRLFGGIVVKSVPAFIGDKPMLVPGGSAVGISIYTEGVLVVGTGSFIDPDGRRVSPAAEAGIKAGDVILLVNGIPIATGKELSSLLGAVQGAAVITVERAGERKEITVVPVDSDSGKRIGAWVRDSTIGIGTLSFYERSSGLTAALGHAVLDADTGALLKVRNGELVLASILGVTKGAQGAPGELHGTFGDDSVKLGTIEGNTELGIFGRLYAGAAELLGGEEIPVAFPDEVHTGNAVIITSAFGEPEEFSCRIIRTGRQNGPAPKGLVIEITDPRLLEGTGGIVQGMSGSPVIQDGMLAGVVTHVFVNDPKKGYGAYAYWMYDLFGGN
ncbi:MAG: SpoIVB peptidase [Clostridia bacterium]|nr:SpoIVB peptidase [Clostridia bacterium]